MYNFSDLTANVVTKDKLTYIKLIKVPDLYKYHAERGEKQMYVDFMKQNANIKLALQEVNKTIYTGKIVSVGL